MGTTTILGTVAGLALLALWAYAFYDLATTPTISRRAKFAWVLIIVLLPYIGVLAYLFSHVGLSGPMPEDALPERNVTDIELDRMRGF